MGIAVVLGMMAQLMPAADFRVAGSDLLGYELTKTLTGYTASDGAKLEIALEGSRPAYEALKSGRADVALITLPAGEEPDDAVFESVSVAWHRIAVVVPESVPLSHITVAQLLAIFGADAPITYNRWGDLGVADGLADSPITVHAPAAGLGLTAEFFRRAVLNGGAFKAYVGRYTSAEDLASRLVGDNRVMVLASGLPAKAKGLKILSVAVRAEDPAFLPTPENLHSGDYPLRLPLRLVFRRDAVPRVLPVLRFMLDDSVAAALESAGIVPDPAVARRQKVAGWVKK